ncbi:MAG: hypothetical protein HWE13_02650 [Gammaproteobacteria bacterium]|nr:hypothetical protein [Gammaproteobacteria bacterium]
MSIGAAVFPSGLPDPRMPSPGEIEVVEAIGQTTQFRLRYGMSIEDGDLPLLSDSLLDPDSILSVVIPGEALPQILVNGPVVRHDINFVQGGDGSTLEVIGCDQTCILDRENKAAVFSNVNDSTVVMTILAQYGIVPDVEPTTIVHSDLKHALVQRESDLRFIRKLARRNGYWFWLSEQAPGVTMGHFKSPPINGQPQADIRINVSEPNVDQVKLYWNSERPVAADLSQVDLNSLTTLDGQSERSTISGLASQHLADIVGSERKIHLAIPSDESSELAARGNSALIDHGWFIRVKLTLRFSVIGKVIRTHSLVSITGLGQRHSGLYLVAKVNHTFTEDDHEMVVELIRNAWN